ncbi:hypothetical protein ING2D1G_1594 [Peptoniphilus sp. ING2-D1G]|nr:hypothetical protein ING2D1G_1594 [Peptoniphilus sp. ING2-D1G]
MKALYINCENGISGDMLVASLLDLSLDFSTFKNQLNKLNLSSFRIEKRNIHKNGKSICDYNVVLENSDNLKNINIFDILEIINKSELSDKVKSLSKKIFKIAAEAGSHAHKLDIKEFFFHEKGVADSFADIVGFAICVDLLEIEEVFFSKIYDGSGFIDIRGKTLPLPVPAVKYLADKYKLNLIKTSIQGELVTPTGASIVVATKSKRKLPQNYKILKSGFGNGKRNYNPEAILKSTLLEI